MIVSVPSSARGREPVTGASRKRMLSAARRSRILTLTSGAIVDMSMAHAPCRIPSAAPLSPNITSSTSGPSGTIVIVMSPRSAAAAGVGAGWAPYSAANASAREGVRFQTVTSNPARTRFAAIGPPMIPRPRNATRSGFAMSATSGGLDSQPVAAPQRTGGLRRHLVAVHEVAARGTGLAAMGALRAVAAALGYQRVGHLLERLDLADHAVAAVVPARTARVAPHRVFDRAQRELELERLDRRGQRVAHRDAHCARAVGVLARALAAAERLV